jgi:hypothetical protein
MKMATDKIMEAKGGGQNLTLEEVRSRITTYEHQMRGFLDSLEANVDGYKFSVEKQGDAFIIDVAIKATVRAKNRTGIPK